jgi:hypothetical protein
MVNPNRRYIFMVCSVPPLDIEEAAFVGTDFAKGHDMSVGRGES